MRQSEKLHIRACLDPSLVLDVLLLGMLFTCIHNRGSAAVQAISISSRTCLTEETCGKASTQANSLQTEHWPRRDVSRSRLLSGLRRCECSFHLKHNPPLRCEHAEKKTQQVSMRPGRVHCHSCPLSRANLPVAHPCLSNQWNKCLSSHESIYGPNLAHRAHEFQTFAQEKGFVPH